MKFKVYAIAAIIIVAVMNFVLIKNIHSLENENERLAEMQSSLLSENAIILAESAKFKISDSINAAKVTELELSLSEYKKIASENYKHLCEIKRKCEELESSADLSISTENHVEIEVENKITPNDTLSVFTYKSEWLDIDGCINSHGSAVAMDIHSREDITVFELVEYKRFLGFLWKTHHIKKRACSAVSKNPNTEITNLRVINIKP